MAVSGGGTGLSWDEKNQGNSTELARGATVTSLFSFEKLKDRRQKTENINDSFYGGNTWNGRAIHT